MNTNTTTSYNPLPLKVMVIGVHVTGGYDERVGQLISLLENNACLIDRVVCDQTLIRDRDGSGNQKYNIGMLNPRYPLLRFLEVEDKKISNLLQWWYERLSQDGMAINFDIMFYEPGRNINVVDAWHYLDTHLSHLTIPKGVLDITGKTETSKYVEIELGYKQLQYGLDCIELAQTHLKLKAATGGDVVLPESAETDEERELRLAKRGEFMGKVAETVQYKLSKATVGEGNKTVELDELLVNVVDEQDRANADAQQALINSGQIPAPTPFDASKLYADTRKAYDRAAVIIPASAVKLSNEPFMLNVGSTEGMIDGHPVLHISKPRPQSTDPDAPKFVWGSLNATFDDEVTIPADTKDEDVGAVVEKVADVSAELVDVTGDAVVIETDKPTINAGFNAEQQGIALSFTTDPETRPTTLSGYGITEDTTTWVFSAGASVGKITDAHGGRGVAVPVSENNEPTAEQSKVTLAMGGSGLIVSSQGDINIQAERVTIDPNSSDVKAD
jgi:hypothetical protein